MSGAGARLLERGRLRLDGSGGGSSDGSQFMVLGPSLGAGWGRGMETLVGHGHALATAGAIDRDLEDLIHVEHCVVVDGPAGADLVGVHIPGPLAESLGLVLGLLELVTSDGLSRELDVTGLGLGDAQGLDQGHQADAGIGSGDLVTRDAVVADEPQDKQVEGLAEVSASHLDGFLVTDVQSDAPQTAILAILTADGGLSARRSTQSGARIGGRQGFCERTHEVTPWILKAGPMPA